ncbi:hypothetical protein CQA49_09720 [Helicobacter sp. MIT 00-7814]|uniref:hypothetical protein n=1 Tax=unclassified Helicobacter TaxID=2593540 RepID=UPI000E1E8FB1|nr:MULTISPECIES: hypothetical protein [unclassified Helicobacter]RDU51325.1 hypothetical protein CQA49_09720 [Helicobacter sp. MIT 00-7814]RDU52710.1 hypothetical protein CQA37_08250 [Helicobacter sp. MIT 99-10781]
MNKKSMPYFASASFFILMVFLFWVLVVFPALTAMQALFDSTAINVLMFCCMPVSAVVIIFSAFGILDKEKNKPYEKRSVKEILLLGISLSFVVIPAIVVWLMEYIHKGISVH